MESINTEIDSLLDKVGVLKGEIGKYNKYIQDKVKVRKQDINDFLDIAGFKYTFDVEVTGENSARALLKFILPDMATPVTFNRPVNILAGARNTPSHSFCLCLTLSAETPKW